jgi:glutamate racemase
MSIPSDTPTPSILVFDSGIGGLTVHAEIFKLLPRAHFVYVADDAAFPYGGHASSVLIERVIAVIGKAIALFNPDIVVIACNTASTVCMPALRKTFSVPFVGTVPAVKPAAALSESKMLSILGTPGTVSREYTHDLIIEHAADCRITLVGAPNLARLAEDFLNGLPVDDKTILTEILPCFKAKEGRRTDVIALACTHYPLLLPVYNRVAPWPVKWVDPAPAIASRVVSLLRMPIDKSTQSIQANGSVALFTSGQSISTQLTKALKMRGLRPTSGLLQPFQKLKG